MRDEVLLLICRFSRRETFFEQLPDSLVFRFYAITKSVVGNKLGLTFSEVNQFFYRESCFFTHESQITYIGYVDNSICIVYMSISERKGVGSTSPLLTTAI